MSILYHHSGPVKMLSFQLIPKINVSPDPAPGKGRIKFQVAGSKFQEQRTGNWVLSADTLEFTTYRLTDPTKNRRVRLVG
jgi:hypothetical protein